MQRSSTLQVTLYPTPDRRSDCSVYICKLDPLLELPRSYSRYDGETAGVYVFYSVVANGSTEKHVFLFDVTDRKEDVFRAWYRETKALFYSKTSAHNESV